MTGGDDFTDISQILERCVLLDVNQTILSNKIFDGITNTQFDGDVELNAMTTNTGTLTNTGTIDMGGTLNLTTDIVADKSTLNITNTGTTVINPQNICALQVAGNDKFVSDIMNTSIYATSALNLSAGGLNTLQMTSANFSNNFATQQTYQVNNATKLLLTNTATTLNNTTTNIQSGAINKITTNASTTTLNNDTTNIQSGGATKIQTTGAITTMNNDTTSIKSGGLDKIVVIADNTSITNTDIATTGILTHTGDATLKGTTIRLQDTTPTTRFTQNNGTTSIINATINLADNTPTTRFQQTNGTTTITNTNIATNGILTQTGDFTAKGTTITLQDATPTTKYLQDSTTTTLTNNYIVSNATTEQRIQVNGGDKFISIVGSTAISDVIMGVSSTSGGLFLTSTLGKITMDTNSTTTDGILIKNKNTGAGGVRIESDGTTGTLALDSAGTLNANTSTGKNSLSSTAGQIELKTGALTNTGINIENTNTTTGGITLKTNGTTGDIVLESGDNIAINAPANFGSIGLNTTGTNSSIALFANATNGGIVSSAFSHSFSGTTFSNDVGTLYRYGNLYPNLSIAGFQSQVATRLNIGYDITLNPAISGVLAVNDCQWISFPFDVKACWATVSFTAGSFSNFTNRTFNLVWTNTSGTVLASGNIGGMANAQRTGTVDYAGEIITAGTDIIPNFVWTGTLGSGGLTIGAKFFCFTMHFQQYA